LTPLGFVPEARPFRAHLTLARVRSPRGLRRVVAAIGDDAPSFGAWTAAEMVLYRSHLRPTGSVYEPLRRCAFAG
jgi:RNA 2',3'-cyclic 3'-phosphodiesterase